MYLDQPVNKDTTIVGNYPELVLHLIVSQCYLSSLSINNAKYLCMLGTELIVIISVGVLIHIADARNGRLCIWSYLSKRQGFLKHWHNLAFSS